MSRLFKRTGSVNPGRSVFDLSYTKKLTCDMGQLIPIMCDEVVPGDIFKIGAEIVIRFQPLVAPILHEINCFIHYFFVPYRLLWSLWESFITGGQTGEDASVLPRWTPPATATNKLWDYLGFPTDSPQPDCEGALPMAFPRSAYNFIYNHFYRDENFITEVALDNEEILLRAWEKDYFTSALPFQQRGTSPALPIAGITNAEFDDVIIAQGTTQRNIVLNEGLNTIQALSGVQQELKDALSNNEVDLSQATSFNISDLRLAFSIQRWMERNARCGVRYVEFLGAHFGVNPRDDRLQRPEYIGGIKTPIVISEVLQTSSTDATSPQGNLAGHGITVDREYAGTYRATEFGLIMGIMSVMPKPAYQQGINRQWLRETRYDFYFPEFANLSEQAIIGAEIKATGETSENTSIFGYAGRYDEMRVKQNQVVSGMRSLFDYWHLGRYFADPVLLNQSFLECVPRKDIFAVQDEHGLIVNVGNIIKAIRPIPVMSNPGLIDH